MFTQIAPERIGNPVRCDEDRRDNFIYFRPVKFISFILRRIWCAWFFLVGASSFILLYPLFFILLRKRSWFRYAFRLKKVWAHIMLFGSGIFYKIKKEGVIDRKRSYVICPNHTSYLDIVLTNIAFSNYFHFMGKAELQTIPLFNIFFKRMNIPVDRTSITSSHKAFNRAKQDIEKGISIAIYPEGTIPESAPDLGPFKNGAFKLAIEMQIPIVPITYLDNWKIFPDKKDMIITVCDGNPILLYSANRRGWISSPVEFDSSYLHQREKEGAKIITGEKRWVKDGKSNELFIYLLQHYKIIVNNDDYFIIDLTKRTA